MKEKNQKDIERGREEKRNVRLQVIIFEIVEYSV
jgi:hypothetical protein